MKKNTWNYRVIDSNANGLGIYEVYYDENGNINYFSTNTVSPRGESLEELKKDGAEVDKGIKSHTIVSML